MILKCVFCRSGIIFMWISKVRIILNPSDRRLDYVTSRWITVDHVGLVQSHG